MKKFRLIYKRLNNQGEHEKIFSTVVLCKSILGAKRKAKELEPFEFDSKEIICLTDEWKLKLNNI